MSKKYFKLILAAIIAISIGVQTPIYASSYYDEPKIEGEAPRIEMADSITLYVNEAIDFDYTSNEWHTTIYSTNSNIVDVGKLGWTYVVGVNPGECNIVVECDESGFTAVCKVTVLPIPNKEKSLEILANHLDSEGESPVELDRVLYTKQFLKGMAVSKYGEHSIRRVKYDSNDFNALEFGYEYNYDNHMSYLDTSSIQMCAYILDSNRNKVILQLYERTLKLGKRDVEFKGYATVNLNKLGSKNIKFKFANGKKMPKKYQRKFNKLLKKNCIPAWNKYLVKYGYFKL
ncbi:hypothetical protein MT487_07555 [Lachnospiraceae bacterium NSJ-171]|nr:hypothetical protein [Lachnospiraceae bacterium NSJ-171]